MESHLKNNRRHFLNVVGKVVCASGGALLTKTAAADQTKITGVYFHEDQGRMKLHLDLDTIPSSYKVFVLDNPQRIVIDLASSRVSTLLSRDLKARGTVRRIRYGKRNHDDLRIVLDVNGKPGTSFVPGFGLRRDGGQVSGSWRCRRKADVSLTGDQFNVVNGSRCSS